jgi:hypothetical protein
LEREAVTGLTVVLQVGKIVVKINPVVFQESMDLHSGAVAKQTPFTISFEGNGLKSGAR